MSRKARIGFTRDFFDEDEKPAVAGSYPLLERMNGMTNVEFGIFPEYLSEVTPEQLQGFDIVISRRAKWTQRSLIGNNQLISVLRNGAGYDVLDVPALTNAGVMLCNIPQATRRPMAVANATFILALSTQLLPKHKITREGRWTWKAVAAYDGFGLIGRTLGSIGVGNIGHEMFMLMKPFGMKHIATTRSMNQAAVDDVDVTLVDLETLLAESDFLTINCPLSPETNRLIGEKELRKMKKTAFLINTARGDIVDEAALARALQEGWIKGAAIDVWQQEPVQPDNPLLKMENVITTPHAMNLTDQTFTVVWDTILEQISELIRGEAPKNIVNREVLDKPEFRAKMERFQEGVLREEESR